MIAAEIPELHSYLTVAQFANAVGLSGNTIRGMVRNGKIANHKSETSAGRSGSRLLISAEELFNTRLNKQKPTAADLDLADAETLIENFMLLPKRVKEKALQKYEIIMSVRHLMKSTGMSKTKAIEVFSSSCQIIGASERNLYRLFEMAELAERAGAPGHVLLGDNRGFSRRGYTKANDYEVAFLQRAWLNQNRTTMRDAYMALTNNLFSCGKSPTISYGQASRILKSIPLKVRDLYRLGETEWMNRYGEWIDRDYTKIAVNEAWVSDHHQLDVPCKGPNGRPAFPWITVIMDCRSRLIVGWHLAFQPNSYTILLALRMAIEKFGCPEHIILDNGLDYWAHIFSKGARKFAGKKKLFDGDSISGQGFAEAQNILDGAFSLLQIIPHYAIPYNARAKSVERFFKTLEEWFGRAIEGYRGSSTEKRPELCDVILKHGRVMTKEALEKLLFGYQTEDGYKEGWLDAYHWSPHTGDAMNGVCPAEVFMDGLKKIRRPSQIALDMCLLRRRTYKVVRGGRVKAYKGWYQAPVLDNFIGKRVVAGADERDLSWVALWDGQGRYLGKAHRTDRLGWFDEKHGFDRDIYARIRQQIKEDKRFAREYMNRLDRMVSPPTIAERFNLVMAQDRPRPENNLPNVIEPVHTPFDQQRQTAGSDIVIGRKRASIKPKKWADLNIPLKKEPQNG